MKPVSFSFEKFLVRAINKSGDIWFIAADVCAALEIKNPRDAVSTLDGDEKDVGIIDTLGGKQKSTIINESGLYALILRSRKAKAKKFRKWVTSEVLPSIRKTGLYTAKRKTTGKITAEMRNSIKQLVIETAKRLPSDKQASAIIKTWAALKSHFGVTYKDISIDKYPEAVSLVARIQTEWELLDNGLIPKKQADEIMTRLNRVGKIFHPFSDQFSDLNGVVKALRGLDPNLGTPQQGYVKLIESVK